MELRKNRAGELQESWNWPFPHTNPIRSTLAHITHNHHIFSYAQISSRPASLQLLAFSHSSLLIRGGVVARCQSKLGWAAKFCNKIAWLRCPPGNCLLCVCEMANGIFNPCAAHTAHIHGHIYRSQAAFNWNWNWRLEESNTANHQKCMRLCGDIKRYYK